VQHGRLIVRTLPVAWLIFGGVLFAQPNIQ
jgi:hypothetical protein